MLEFGRGRPKGSKNKVRGVGGGTLEEWAIIYHEGGDVGKAIILDKIEGKGLEEAVILERMAAAYAHRNYSPELRQVAEAEVYNCLTTLQENVLKSPTLTKLREITPQSNIIINLSNLDIERVKRPTPRVKKEEADKSPSVARIGQALFGDE